MTHRAELNDLREKARRAGRVANFCFNEQGQLDGVFYLDPHGPGRQRAGMLLDPLGFAERERAKPGWWELQNVNERQAIAERLARLNCGRLN